MATAGGAQGVEHSARVAVGGVDGDHVNSRVHQAVEPLQRFLAHAQGRGAQQPAALVHCPGGIVDLLENVFDRDQPLQPPVAIDQGQLFDPVAVEDALGLLQAGAHGGSDQAIARHEIGDGLRAGFDEARIAVGQDANEATVTVGDGDTGDVVAAHQGLGRAQGVVGPQRQRVDDHT